MKGKTYKHISKFKDYIFENENGNNNDHSFQKYYYQIINSGFEPLSDELWDGLLMDGFPEEVNNYQGDFNQNNYEYIKLDISEEDKDGLKNGSDQIVDKYNDFDIWLKEEQKLYPKFLDFVDYEKGEVYIINHKPTELLKESAGFSPSAAFGATDLSGVNTGGNTARDPNLSFDAWDHEKHNMRDQLKRMSDILMNVFSSGSINFSQELVDIIEDLTIVKIFRNRNGSLDIYLKFFYEEEVFYGVFKNWGTISDPKFVSRIFDIPAIGFYKENRIKIENILKNVLEEWFRPKEEKYIALKEVKVYDYLGNIKYIPKGGKIEIINVISEDHEPEIELMYSNQEYLFKGLDFYFFHWWFSAIEKQEFYL